MSNEFNNNNENQNNLNQNNLNQNSFNQNQLNQEGTSNSSPEGYTNYSQYNLFGTNSNEQQPNYNNGYQSYTTTGTPEMKEPKKKKEWKGLKSAIRLTAAAVVFGIVAGATFQGYYYISQPATIEEDNTQVAQVTQTDSSDTVEATTTSTGEVVTDVSDVVENVIPSIVAINSTITSTYQDFFGREYTEEGEGSGSGIIIGQNDTSLLIVTNNHVIEGATTVEIVFVDESTAEATVKGSDANSDLAVLSVDMSTLSEETAAAIKVATLGSSEDVKAGELAIAIGNALGYGQSVTVGYISAVEREVTIDDTTMTLIQTDAAINPGNSGGALLNANGEVIGINSVKYASEEVEGMGYAIPISSAIPMINELISREVIAEEEQGFLGINITTAQDVTSVYAERFNMPIGVYVNEIIEGSPAEAAGLVQGDIITGVDETAIETTQDLIEALSYKKAGEEINLIIQQKENGAYVEKTLVVTLGEKN